MRNYVSIYGKSFRNSNNSVVRMHETVKGQRKNARDTIRASLKEG